MHRIAIPTYKFYPFAREIRDLNRFITDELFQLVNKSIESNHKITSTLF